MLQFLKEKLSPELKYIIYLIMAVICIIGVLIFFKTYPDLNNPHVQGKALTVRYDSSQKIIDSMASRIKSDSFTIISLNALSNQLLQQYKSTKQQIKAIQINTFNKDSSIKKMDCIQIDTAIEKRYPADTNTANCAIALKQNIWQDVLIDLSSYDSLQKTIPLYNQSAAILLSDIKNRDSALSVSDSALKDYRKSVQNYSAQRDILVTQRNDAESQLKKSKFKTIIAGAAAVIFAVIAIIK